MAGWHRSNVSHVSSTPMVHNLRNVREPWLNLTSWLVSGRWERNWSTRNMEVGCSGTSWHERGPRQINEGALHIYLSHKSSVLRLCLWSPCYSLNSVLALKSHLSEVPKNGQYGFYKWGPIYNKTGFWAGLENLKVFFDRLNAMICLAKAARSSISDVFRVCIENGRFLMDELPTDQPYRNYALES